MNTTVIQLLLLPLAIAANGSSAVHAVQEGQSEAKFAVSKTLTLRLNDFQLHRTKNGVEEGAKAFECGDQIKVVDAETINEKWYGPRAEPRSLDRTFIDCSRTFSTTKVSILPDSTTRGVSGCLGKTIHFEKDADRYVASFGGEASTSLARLELKPLWGPRAVLLPSTDSGEVPADCIVDLIEPGSSTFAPALDTLRSQIVTTPSPKAPLAVPCVGFRELLKDSRGRISYKCSPADGVISVDYDITASLDVGRLLDADDSKYSHSIVSRITGTASIVRGDSSMIIRRYKAHAEIELTERAIVRCGNGVELALVAAWSGVRDVDIHPVE